MTQTPKKINCKKCNAECTRGNKNYCTKCFKSFEKSEVKRKEKIKKKKETIAVSTLDKTFSDLVRTIYPPICHSSNVELPFEKAVAAHFIQRENYTTRWDLRNVYPTTNYENRRNQTHVLFLGDRIYEYFGIDWRFFIAVASIERKTIKISGVERREMYNVFKEGIIRAKEILLINNTEEVEYQLQILRDEIVLQTKKIM